MSELAQYKKTLLINFDSGLFACESALLADAQDVDQWQALKQQYQEAIDFVKGSDLPMDEFQDKMSEIIATLSEASLKITWKK